VTDRADRPAERRRHPAALARGPRPAHEEAAGRTEPGLEPASVEFLVPQRKARIDEVVAHRTRTLTVVMEAFCDPQNVNAVLRTCEAFGVQEVHVVEGVMKPYDRNRKISQNADKWLDVRRWKSTAECLAHLQAEGFAIYVTHLGPSSRPLEELSFAGRVALVFGNEQRGVSPEALTLAHLRYAIPMRGFVQSLNVSVAAAVSLARAVERRLAERGRHGDLSSEEASQLRKRFYVLAVKQRARIAKAAAVAERKRR
jgi:tRNA (guanosine-2'-O-)-methyltransferase